MAITVLTDDLKQKLEQERSRLTEERETVIQTVVKQATAEIDRTLAHIEQLLGASAVETVPSSAPAAAATPKTKAAPKATAKAAPKVATKPAATKATSTKGKSAKGVPSKATPAPTAKASRSAPPARRGTTGRVAAKATSGKAAIKEKSSSSTSSKSFDSKQMKSEFKNLSVVDAIKQVMQKSPDKSFSTDDLIEILYDKFDPAQIPNARKSVSLVIAQSVRRKVFEKVQENPSRFKLKS